MMIRRTLVVLLVVGASGNGQAWLLHAHDEHPWHAHAIDLSGGLGSVSSDSLPSNGHEHDDPLPLESSDAGIVVVLNSAPAIPGSTASDVQLTLGAFSSNPTVTSTCQALSTSTMHEARLWQRQCAHPWTSPRSVESLLRSNHAILI